jgi:TolB protein
MKLRFLMIWLVFSAGMAFSQAPDAIIRPVANPTRLAVSDFVSRVSANQDTLSALKVFNKVLFDDLKFSAVFEIPSKSFYPLKPLRVPQDVVFENWQVPSLDVDYLAFGTLQVDSATTIAEAYLYDVKTMQQVLGKRYRITDTSLIRRVAHEFADQIVYELSAGASQGVAKTKIAFSSKRGDSKEIYIMDYDGHNAEKLSINGGINKFPEWSPDNSLLSFVTILPNSDRWSLWILKLGGGHSTLETPGSYVSSPAFAPHGSLLAFSARTENSLDSDIFVSSPDGAGRRNLTRFRGIDTSPTWSPTGTQIAFISDRTGSPQVWVMDADGSNVRRLVQEGGHCDSPDWSPDGRFILYSWQAPSQWKHDIYMLEVATNTIYQLTHGRGSSESPHWSPDGRHIAFQNTRSGTKQIYIMNVNGENLKMITAYGENESPSWAKYPPSSMSAQ